jgi:hypothetical protein
VDLSICDDCDDYCDIYDACDEYYYIYDVCDEYYDIYDIPVIFGYFKREKQKNAMATLSCVLWKTHGKVDKTNSRNSAFVVHLKGRTVKVPFIAVRFVPRRTTKSPSLSCVLCLDALQRASHVVSPRRCQLLFLPCAARKRTAKIIYHALSGAAHGKGALPCKMLPCALCHAPR